MRVAPRAVGQLFQNKNSRLGQAGDTIVEVLIALAIISLMLVGAFAVTRHSTATVQDTQEHMQALSIANAQLEFLRQRQGLDASQACFDSLGSANVSGSNGCKYDSNGNSGCSDTTAAYCYTVKITSQDAEAAPATSPTKSVNYNVAVTWQSLLNGDTGSTALSYKLAQSNPDYIPPLGSDALGNAVLGHVSCSELPGGCSGSRGGKYDFGTAVRNNTVSVPVADIIECKWDFGDTSVTPQWLPPSDPNSKCLYGDVQSHNYRGAPEMDSPPTYPDGCYVGNVKSPFTHTYSITLTIHVRGDKYVRTEQPFKVWEPSCP